MSLRKISKQALFVVLAASLCITSCEKDPQKEPQSGQTKKITKVAQDATNYSAFEYNANGNLSKMIVASDDQGNPEITTITYNYNDQKKPTGLNFASIADFKYLYTGNKITKVELYSNNILAAYDVLTYTGERITKIEKYFKTAGSTFELNSKSDCIYFENGNIKEIETFVMNAAGQPELFFTRQFLQYDNKKSPFTSLSEANIAIFLDFVSVNNITRLKTLGETGATQSEVETTYTYDAAGYPLTSTAKTTEGGATTTKTATFTYQ